MFISDALKINEKGNLTIGGCDAVGLASKYGTPLYVMDEMQIRRNCREYKNALDLSYDSKGMILYAGKAFLTKAVCKIADEEGLGLDVVSGGELYTAIKAGFTPEKIFFHGNIKTKEEIKMAIDYGIGCFVIDSREDLFRVNGIAKEVDKQVTVSLRLKPGIDAHTHDFIRTGQSDSKFGIDIETGEALGIVKEILKLSNVQLKGIHCHIGSQIFDYPPFEEASRVMLGFIKNVKDETGYVISQLNLGGGYGIKYVAGDNPINFGEYIKAISVVVKSFCEENKMEIPFILMEPGRSIVASAGVTLYKAEVIKDIKNVRKYVIVDGSFADNPRYALYKAEYECIAVTKPTEPRTETVTIAGRTCESGDVIIKDISMPIVNEGDILAVPATGAYNYSMSSNYNRLPRPAVVMTCCGEDRLIVKPETYEDLLRNDL